MAAPSPPVAAPVLDSAPSQASPSVWRGWPVPVSVGVVLALLPAVLTPYTQDLVVKVAILAIFALSLELLVGPKLNIRHI